nr:MAG TPA: hypothetical protein [Caudoviricetes sp.]
MLLNSFIRFLANLKLHQPFFRIKFCILCHKLVHPWSYNYLDYYYDNSHLSSDLNPYLYIVLQTFQIIFYIMFCNHQFHISS